MLRAQDTINTGNTHRFIMAQCDEIDSRHPFLYAKVLGIYHAEFTLPGQSRTRLATHRIDFLWVRWLDEASWGGWSKKQLDRVAYVEGDGASDAFGFLDPICIIRGCHLIPAFEFGRSTSNISTSIAWDSSTEGDWDSYTVNRCALVLLKLDAWSVTQTNSHTRT